MVKIKWTEKASKHLQIIYEYIADDHIDILAVVHGAQDIQKSI